MEESSGWRRSGEAILEESGGWRRLEIVLMEAILVSRFWRSQSGIMFISPILTQYFISPLLTLLIFHFPLFYLHNTVSFTPVINVIRAIILCYCVSTEI